MLLRDLSSAITQQCSNKFKLDTQEDHVENINNDKIDECPSVDFINNMDSSYAKIEKIQIGRIVIYQNISSESYSEIKAKRPCNSVVIILPSIQGSSIITSDNNHYEINQRTGVIISDFEENIIFEVMESSIHIMVIIPLNLIEITFTTLIGKHPRPAIKFFPIIEGRFSPWMQILSTAVYGNTISQHYESIRESLEHLITSGLILTYSNNYSDTFEKLKSTPPPRTVRRAINFMEEHMNEPISISEVAAHASVGMRALQLSFRKYMGMSPGEWLSDRRLDRVHAMLMEEETTVTQAALAWGFCDLSDFSARYQKRYGYLPSKTPHRP